MKKRYGSELFQRIRFRGQPTANPDSVVVSGHARFTVLTPRLLRLEWSETGKFEDRGTYAFPTRYAPAPSYRCKVVGQTLTIDTGALLLRYAQNSGEFAAGNLSITLEIDGQPITWVPGTPSGGAIYAGSPSAPGNLRGTRRTLDGCEGEAALDEGLLSRAGWSLFDDSRSVLFDPDDGWVMPPRKQQVQDWYFFGYGHDYKGALGEYVRFGSRIPLIPRYVLGAWWSRYWAYSAHDLKDLIHDFEDQDLPLDVLVIDMDWHTPFSWTGYTWNRELFSDPPAFLAWVHGKGLRVTLNLHPAEGVQPFEEIYPRFAEAMGVDPEDGEAIPFRITDPVFVKNYFELLHHPMENDVPSSGTGVDFWWMDWQQGESSEMEGLDPLLWINHLHFADSTRRGQRAMLYSRWGGLGNHRYQMGFSGDTWIGWPALQFQPYFTATASNVLYGWWGHDIGGHMGGATEPELYARWVQYGTLSPALRLHATKDPLAERRPWKYPEEVYQAAKAAFQWRYQLLPYIYTMARAAHDTGVSLCRPMYYEYPEEDAAYTARTQYFFGDQMIASPIVQPADPQTGLAATDVWIPEGTWIEYTTKEIFVGPRWVRLVGDLNRVPMLMRAGAILPLASPFETTSPSQLASGTTDAIPSDRLIVSIFPGSQGEFRLYEDDGITEAYKEGQYEWTQIDTRMDDPDSWAVHIAPVEGHCDALPSERSYEIRFEGSQRPDMVTLNGLEIDDWCYDPDALKTTVQIPPHEKAQPFTVKAVARGGISALGVARNRQLLLADASRLLGEQCPSGTDEDALLDAALHLGSLDRMDPFARRSNAIARLGGPLVRFIEFTAPEDASQQLGRIIVGSPSRPGETFDLLVTWTLQQGRETRQETFRVEGATEPQIVNAPFAFEGQVRTMRWAAKVAVTWRGQKLVYTYQSHPLFPTIYAWQAVVYNQDLEPLPLEQVLDHEEEADERMGWVDYVQTVDGLKNVNQPHGVFLSREYEQELRAGTPLAAYARTTVTSPDEREAIIRFRAAGFTQFYLSGQEIEEVPVEQEGWLPALLRKARSTAVMRLKPGKNTLVVRTRPPQEKRPWWYLGGWFATPDGALMTDLEFEARDESAHSLQF
ncbi:MAG TPA: TIM-barrel domain-containing protein [Anaerolineae bacterium]|nr:TIM-barrel domain-containing protein [Anaerolineae bacterium]